VRRMVAGFVVASAVGGVMAGGALTWRTAKTPPNSNRDLPRVSLAEAPEPFVLPARYAKPVPVRVQTLALGDMSRARLSAPRHGVRHREVRRTLPTTGSFSALGVTWVDDPGVGEVHVALRTRPASGRSWTAWRSVEADEEQVLAPRGRRVRGGTDLIWTGRSAAVDVVVESTTGHAPRDVRVDLIDPGYGGLDAAMARVSVGGGPPRSGQSAGVETGAVFEPVVAPAQATAAIPPAMAAGAADVTQAKANYGNNVVTIRSRADWGADPKLMTWDPEYAPAIKAATFHHTATTTSYPWAEVPAILRSIYRFQSVSRGWGDIGYNVLVDKYGYAWEGRAGGITRPVIGAHAGGFNTGTVGVAVIGDFSTSPPPAAAVEGVARVLAYKLGISGVNPRIYTLLVGGPSTKFATRAPRRLATIFPHRDTSATTCPGNGGMTILTQLRLRTDALIKQYKIVPPPAPSPSPSPSPSQTPTPTPMPITTMAATPTPSARQWAARSLGR
jgi:hypothetical protein